MLYLQFVHLILQQAAPWMNNDRKESRIMDEIPEDVAYNLSLLGGMTGLFARVPSNEMLEQRVRIHKALADPTRLKILHLLAAQPLCVSVMKHCLRMADSRISYHLHILKETGLIEARQEKNWIIYRISDEGKMYLDMDASAGGP
jgi:DNA-binding transcriptional ArsR family regulator